MEGYLEKSTTYFSRWKRRYFILRDNILYYYKEKGGELSGRIHLSIAKIQDYDKNDTKFEKADKVSVRDNWVNKIKEAQYSQEAYEREYIKRNHEMLKSDSNSSALEEIINLQSKLDVIRNYTKILESYNDKIFNIVQQKNMKQEIMGITKECHVNINILYFSN